MCFHTSVWIWINADRYCIASHIVKTSQNRKRIPDVWRPRFLLKSMRMMQNNCKKKIQIFSTLWRKKIERAKKNVISVKILTNVKAFKDEDVNDAAYIFADFWLMIISKMLMAHNTANTNATSWNEFLK